jgi:hypothetical protein
MISSGRSDTRAELGFGKGVKELRVVVMHHRSRISRGVKDARSRGAEFYVSPKSNCTDVLVQAGNRKSWTP